MTQVTGDCVEAAAGRSGARRLGTTRQVAEYLHMTTNALHLLRHEGKAPPAAKVGTRLLWAWDDVDEWLAARTSVTPRRPAA